MEKRGGVPLPLLSGMAQQVERVNFGRVVFPEKSFLVNSGYAELLCCKKNSMSKEKGIPGFGGRFLDDPTKFVAILFFGGRLVSQFFWWTFFGGRLVSHFFGGHNLNDRLYFN